MASSEMMRGRVAIALASKLLPYLSPYDARLYGLCRRYVDRYNGENNSDIRANGELHFMSQVLGNCHTVFDVGANVGEWAELALGINPTLELHCFEPSRNTYRRLVSRFGSSNLHCNNIGLGSAEEDRTLYVFQEESGLNSLYKRHGLEDGCALEPQQRTETVRLDTIDHYCLEHGIDNIDFLKVDVEGHELDVFRGALGMLAQRKINIIQFEYGGCNIDARVLLKDIFEFLAPLGHTFHKVYPQELRQVKRYDQRFEDFQYQNWVVMRADVL